MHLFFTAISMLSLITNTFLQPGELLISHRKNGGSAMVWARIAVAMNKSAASQYLLFMSQILLFQILYIGLQIVFAQVKVAVVNVDI